MSLGGGIKHRRPHAAGIRGPRAQFTFIGACNYQFSYPAEKHDLPRTRTWNLRLRRPTPYPLGQRASASRAVDHNTSWGDWADLTSRQRLGGHVLKPGTQWGRWWPSIWLKFVSSLFCFVSFLYLAWLGCPGPCPWPCCLFKALPWFGLAWLGLASVGLAWPGFASLRFASLRSASHRIASLRVRTAVLS